MIKEIKMPNLGTTVDEVKIIKWLKNIGDKIERGEPIVEVETDKATMEVESYLAGYLKKIAIDTGATAAAGSVVAYMGDEADVLEETAAVESKPLDIEIKASGKTEAVNATQVKISPMIKKLAEKYALDISKIIGTGPEGLILKEDIMLAAASGQSSHGQSASGQYASGQSVPVQSAPGQSSSGQSDHNNSGRTIKQSEAVDDTPQLVPFTRNGFAVANAMTRSKSGIPHVYFSIDVDATSMKKQRESSGKKYSYNAMLLFNIVKSLVNYPYLMARYDEKGRIMAKAANIGIAVAKGDELYVPVVKNIVDGENELSRIEQEINRLTRLVASGDIKQEDISGGVFTLTNLGSYGISAFSAVINPPEVGILAAGAVRDSVVVENGGIIVRPIITLTLSVDHRVVNGNYAAQFLNQLKENLERM